MLQEVKKKFRHKRYVEIFNFGDSYILFIRIHLPFYSFQIWNQLERKKSHNRIVCELMGFLLKFNRKRYFSLMIYCFFVSWPVLELSMPKMVFVLFFKTHRKFNLKQKDRKNEHKYRQGSAF